MSKGFRFEPTINYGTLIQVALIVLSLISAWHKMDKVLVDHEARIKSLERNAFGQVKPPEIKYESARKPGS